MTVEPVQDREPRLLQAPLFPLAWFDSISIEDANGLLAAWGHRMGPLNRTGGDDHAHVLAHRTDGPLLLVTTSPLINPCVGGGLGHLNRSNAVELSRLCAARPGLCRLGLRLWREIVFPLFGKACAVSYQDADMHTGGTYRFDGWGRSPRKAHSGTDTRSGRPGRDKWVWVWPASGAAPP